MKQGYFKTGKRLTTALDNIDRIEGLQEHLDNHFVYLMFDTDSDTEDILQGKLSFLPNWASEGAIDYALPVNTDYELDDLRIEYVQGYYDSSSYGDEATLFDIVDDKEQEFIYFASVVLPEEMEHQADDGTFCCECRGSSYMRVWKLVNNDRQD